MYIAKYKYCETYDYLNLWPEVYTLLKAAVYCWKFPTTTFESFERSDNGHHERPATMTSL